MGYFSELDLKIRLYLPNYLDLPLPACPQCGKKTRITGFIPERTLVLTCTACNRRFDHFVDSRPRIRRSGPSGCGSNSSTHQCGGIHGRHRSEGG